MKLRIITALAVSLISVQAIAAAPAANAPVPTTASTMAANAQAAHTAAAAQPAQMAQTSPMTLAENSAASAAPKPASSSEALTSEKDKVSYSLGANIGSNFKTHGLEVNTAAFDRGLNDAINGKPLAMTSQEMTVVLSTFQKQLVAKQQAMLEAVGAKNKQEGDTFLAANKTKPGVQTTASGLEYKVITKGKGAAPTDKDIVTVDYSGSFLNGKVFDSSSLHGKQPVTFPVSEVIPGWTEALKMMSPGSVYEIYVPANLAYGERGFGDVIGPNQTLIFKIHLISVKKA
jgi:FKBP-type peptidyl-prolyl cis-trans isomerase FklB